MVADRGLTEPIEHAFGWKNCCRIGVYVHLLTSGGHATIPSEAIDGDQVEQGTNGKVGECLPRTNAPFFAFRGCRGDLMVKRKCGTCRHFKDGGIAGSGWCQHHARKDIQHMVLVRKTELACRNSWDQDLWELADRPIDIQTSTHIPLPLSGGEPHEIPVIQAEQPAEDAARAGEMFTDRITSISMPTRSQLRPGRPDPDQHSIDDTAEPDLLDARSSVREARKRRQEQRHLERRKHQETVLKRADDLLDTSEPANDVDRSIARVRAVDGPMTANHDERREPPVMDENAHTSDQPHRESPGQARRRRSAEPVESLEFKATPSKFESSGKPATAKPPSNPVGAATVEKKNGAGSHAAFKRGETEPLPSAAEVRDAVSNERYAKAGGSSQPDRRITRSPANPSTSSGDSSHGEPNDLPPPVEPRPTTWFTGAGHRPPDLVPEAAPYAVDPIDLSRDLKSVRRCCATCRDFKQVGDGRTGWCNNPYAFSEKRMVQSNEIACRSSLGVWWLPHDDLWLEYADTTHHGRPTPLLDDLVGVASTGRQEMGQRSS